MEDNKKFKEAISAKPLYVSLLEKYTQNEKEDFEEKKKQFQKIREMSKPINFEEIQKF